MGQREKVAGRTASAMRDRYLRLRTTDPYIAVRQAPRPFLVDFLNRVNSGRFRGNESFTAAQARERIELEFVIRSILGESH